LSARFFNSAKSGRKSGESSDVDDKGREQATVDAEPHNISEIHQARADILAENINKVLSGVAESLQAIVTAPSGPVRYEKVQDGGRAERISALLSNPDGTKRRALITSGVWESGISGCDYSGTAFVRLHSLFRG
jgi:hypothetical protein